jgi:hypothetical protein
VLERERAPRRHPRRAPPRVAATVPLYTHAEIRPRPPVRAPHPSGRAPVPRGAPARVGQDRTAVHASPPAAPPAPRARMPAEVAAVPRPESRRSLHREASESHLFKAAESPSRTLPVPPSP